MADLLEQYLNLSRDQARAEWRKIISRQPRPRQEEFLPIEVLLCFGLFYRLNPHRYGGANIDQAPAEVKLLATTLKRTPGSLTNKMLNLEGAREHGARQEPELFLQLGKDRDLFATLYARVIEAARAERLGPEQVPDFLGAVDLRGTIEMLGQEELGPAEVSIALDQQVPARRRLQKQFDFDDLQTSRLVEQRIRLGQHRFAAQVLADFEWACGFCGFAPGPLRGHRLLVASHIKPWSRSTDRERADPRNGICTCPIHDSAFDTGLLTLDWGLRIQRAKSLEALLGRDDGIDHFFGARILQERLLVPDGVRGPAPRYVAFHYEYIFQG